MIRSLPERVGKRNLLRLWFFHGLQIYGYQFHKPRPNKGGSAGEMAQAAALGSNRGGGSVREKCRRVSEFGPRLDPSLICRARHPHRTLFHGKGTRAFEIQSQTSLIDLDSLSWAQMMDRRSLPLQMIKMRPGIPDHAESNCLHGPRGSPLRKDPSSPRVLA